WLAERGIVHAQLRQRLTRAEAKVLQPDVALAKAKELRLADYHRRRRSLRSLRGRSGQDVQKGHHSSFASSASISGNWLGSIKERASASDIHRASSTSGNSAS